MKIPALKRWEADNCCSICHDVSVSRGKAQVVRAVTVVTGMIVASGAAAFVLALLIGSIRLFPIIFIVVGIVGALFGLPAYLAARMARRDTPVVAGAVGFALAAAIPALLVLSGAPDQASLDGTATVVDGSYTAAGWLQNLILIGAFGLLGLGAALLFWFAVRRRPEIAEGAVASPWQLAQATIFSVAAAGVITAMFVISQAAADRTCHNPLRNGGTSIGYVATFDLRVGVDEWRNIEAEMAAFRNSGDWQVRSDVRTDANFPWLQISFCKEEGTNIFVMGVSEFNEVSFGVFQPQGGTSWRRDFRALHQQISARWPGRVFYTDRQGRQTRAPEWVAADQATPQQENRQAPSK